MTLIPYIKAVISFLLELPFVQHYDRLLPFLPEVFQKKIVAFLRYDGELVSINDGYVHGWAWCKFKPNLPIAVDIYNGNHRLATILADAAYGNNENQDPELGNGRHGFSYRLPETLDRSQMVLISVKHQGTSIDLKHHSPKLIGNHPTQTILTNTPWIHSPFFESLLEIKCHNDKEKQMAVQYHKQGYIVVEEVVEDDLIERIKKSVTPLYDPNALDGPRSYYRVQDAWQEIPVVRELAASEKIYSILRFLYEREPRPFQTLNFKYGTQQRNHTDFIHFNSLPNRYMCGVWVALEDMTAENGPLFYYPGSHQEPGYTYYDMVLPLENSQRSYEDFIEQLMVAQKYSKKELHVKKGSALIWSSNLVHGGSSILKPGSTRWSQVTHYFFENCLYYSPRDSNPISGDYCLLQLQDVKTGQPLQHTYNGLPIKFKDVGNRRHKISL